MLKPENPPAKRDAGDEIAALLETLSATERRLRELTSGDSGPVMVDEDRAFLIQRAKDIVARLDTNANEKNSGAAATPAENCYHNARRKADLEALRESEQRFAGAFEHAPIGVALVAPGGHWIKVNRALCELVGYSESELLSKKFQDITHPDDLAADLDFVDQLLAGKMFSYQMEKRYIHARGHLVTILLHVSLVRDTKGRPNYFISQILDITERQRAIAEIRFNEQRYRSLVEATSAIVWNTPSSGKFETEQPRWTAFTGQSFEELRGWGWLEAVHPDDQQETLRRWLEAVSNHHLYEVEQRLRAADMSYRNMLVRAVPIQEPDGTILQWIGVHTDITARKQAEEELAKTHRKLLEISRQAGMAEVATGVLHNVGNVLNSVNVSSMCVADSVRKSKCADLTHIAELMRAHAGHLGEFMTQDSQGVHLAEYIAQLAIHLHEERTANLKELSGLQSNVEHIKEIVARQQSFAKMPGLLQSMNVIDLVEDALLINAASLRSHGIEVVKDYESVPQIQVEKHKLLQVLINLMRNAKDACKASSNSEKRLSLRVSNGLNRVRIEVGDNGVGIPPENLTRIFAYGFTTKKNGHGFGLHSGILAVQEMGGALNVRSEGNGLGATFTVELPLDPTTCSISGRHPIVAVLD